MNKSKEKDLLNTYKRWLNSFLEDAPAEQLDEIASPNIMGYGTTTEERVFGINQVKELCRMGQEQKKYLKDYHYSLDIINKQYSQDEKCAVIIAEMDLNYTYNEVKANIPLRISTVFFSENGKWQIVHWHGSTPVETEAGDTWHADEWKKENDRLQKKVEEQTKELRQSLENLKSTQAQLIQSEKMASLGELTAGIAHEIQNPLNFVNNFSEVSVEMMQEVREEIATVRAYRDKPLPDGALDEISTILDDIESNLGKITHHGKRADGIVKGMLQHSRGGSGKMEATDLNALIKEYTNLAFHGMRAKKNPINVEIDLQLDPNIETVSLISEDFSRVILNLTNNAFDAMRETADERPAKLTVRTKQETNAVVIEVEDNGPGIPDAIKDKILQPFFTTKKGTEGTGLGLSITNDIIKAHGGHLEIKSVNEGAIFKLTLPAKPFNK